MYDFYKNTWKLIVINIFLNLYFIRLNFSLQFQDFLFKFRFIFDVSMAIFIFNFPYFLELFKINICFLFPSCFNPIIYN